MKRLSRILLTILVFCALADFLIFSWWLPNRFTSHLSKSIGGENPLNFNAVELNWMDGRLSGGSWGNEKFYISLGEGSFSYSSLDWLIHSGSKIEHLSLRDFGLKVLNDSEGGDLWSLIEEIRLNPMDFNIQSVDLSGEIDFGDFSTPISLFAEFVQKGQSVKSAIEVRLNNEFSVINNLLPAKESILLKVYIKRQKISGNQNVSILISDDQFFNLALTSDGISQKVTLDLSFESDLTSFLEISASRPLGQANFNGDWNASLSSQSFAHKVPIFALLNASAEANGSILFNSSFNNIELNGDLNGELSSFLLPQEGKINGKMNFASSFNQNTWRVDKANLSLENEKEEGVICKIDDFEIFPLKVGSFRLDFESFNLGRLSRHFTDSSQLSGGINGIIEKGNLQLSSNHLIFTNQNVTQKGIEFDISVPIFSKLSSFAGGDFIFRFAPSFEFLNLFLPHELIGFDQASRNELFLQGKLLPSSWLIEKGKLELLDGVKLSNIFEVKNPFEFHFDMNEEDWRAINESKEKVVNFSLSQKTFSLDFPFRDFAFSSYPFDIKGEICLEKGRIIWKLKSLKVLGNLKSSKENLSEQVELAGDLSFYTDEFENGIFQIKQFSLAHKKKGLLKGDLSLLVNKEGDVQKLSGANFLVTPFFFSFIDFHQNGIFLEPSIRIQNFEWIWDEKNEFQLDGFVSLIRSGAKKINNDIFEFPIKWTYSEKNKSFSQWVQLFLKEIESSELEINYYSENEKILINAKALRLVELYNLINDISFTTDEINEFKRNWLSKLITTQFQIDVKEIIINPKIKLSNLSIVIDKSNKYFLIKALLDGSPLSGKLELFTEEGSELRVGKLRCEISGDEMNATSLNFLFHNRKYVSGLINFKTVIESNLQKYSVKSDLSFQDLSINLLPNMNSSSEVSLKDRMEKRLGTVFTWSSSQTKILELFRSRLQKVFFEKGKLAFARNYSGEWNFKLIDWNGPELSLMGNGSISETNNFKINLFPGMRGKLGDLFEALNILSDGKKRQGYRLLKREPLVIEGSDREIKLTNWWKMFGEGIGLEPLE